VALAILTLASAETIHAAPVPTDPAGGFWLLDVAWDQAANLPQAPTRADATELVCLLQAAVRMEPDLAEAWHLQYDLLNGLGRPTEAAQALGKYVALAGDDEPAYLAYASAQVAQGQTAEHRLSACNTWLARKDLPAPVASFLHRTVAEILLNRLQNEQALPHAQMAVRAFPYDLNAQRLLLDLSGQKGPVADLLVALWAVRRNPADTGAIVQVASLADAMGLHNEASTWYAAARQLAGKIGLNDTDLSLRIAGHWLDAGQPDKAAAAIIPLTSKPRATAEAWLLLSNAYEMMGKPEEARQAAGEALKVFWPETSVAPTTTAPTTSASLPVAASTGPASQPVSLTTRVQADWIRLMYLDEPGTVMDTAQAAVQSDADPLWGRRTLGWSLLRANQADKAIEVFSPAAEIDPWSALGLAEALHQRGDKQAADRALQALQRLGPTGPAWWMARRWSKASGVPLPMPQAAQVGQAQTLLAGFNKTLLRLPMEPNQFLEVKVQMDDPPAIGEPWFGRVQLTNISDQPIYCGPDGALMPNVLLSAMVYNPATRDIGQRLLLSLYRRMVLAPRESITLYRPLDTGPLRQALRDPYHDVTVVFAAILDPIRTPEGTWQAGPTGLIAEPVTAHRPPTSLRSGEELLRLARTGTQAEKIEIARQIACITVGVENRTSAQTQPAVPSSAVLTQAFAALLQDSDPTVVAHSLAQADHVALTDALAKAASPQVGSDPWLTRLLAIRLFAHKQGSKFVRALGGLATGDPDVLVRQLTGAYHAAFQAGKKGS
jgi:tetratricopeptide (TPR) repeat protein